MTSANPDQQILTCSLDSCGKQFATRLSLRRHLVIHHLGFRKFVCNFCGRQFAQNQYLKEHINIHTSDEPYACDFPGCTERFKQRSRLCVHKKKHDKGAPKKERKICKKKTGKLTINTNINLHYRRYRHEIQIWVQPSDIIVIQKETWKSSNKIRMNYLV